MTPWNTQNSATYVSWKICMCSIYLLENSFQNFYVYKFFLLIFTVEIQYFLMQNFTIHCKYASSFRCWWLHMCTENTMCVCGKHFKIQLLTALDCILLPPHSWSSYAISQTSACTYKNLNTELNFWRYAISMRT